MAGKLVRKTVRSMVSWLLIQYIASYIASLTDSRDVGQSQYITLSLSAKCYTVKSRWLFVSICQPLSSGTQIAYP